MKIAIVDTGVDLSHSAFEGIRYVSGLTIRQNEDESLTIIPDVFEDEVGHGTSILEIITQHTDTVEPHVIKLKGYQGNYTEELIEEGIRQALLIDDVRIVNVSMGIITDAPSAQLKELCEQAYNRGVFVVASANSDTTQPCYPAYFDYVFGVGKGYFVNYKQFQYAPHNRINVLAKGAHQRIAVLNNAYTYSNGTSFATAHFTGILYRIIEKTAPATWNEAIRAIQQQSCPPIIDVPLNFTKSEEVLSTAVSKETEFSFYAALDDSVQKIAIFPVNGAEMVPLLSCREIFAKQIVLGIDFPGTRPPDSAVGLPFIDRIPIQAELRLFDTVVLGDITTEFGIDSFKHNMLRTFVRSDKNFITWDRPIYLILQQIIQQEHTSYGGKIYCPYYSETFLKESYLNLSLPPSEDIPSLVIIKMNAALEGTFYQQTISNSLKQGGYTPSNIVVEPHGVLFKNLDMLFPYTAKRMVDLEWEKWEVFLRLAKRAIACAKKPDIFLSGVGQLSLGNRLMAGSQSHIDGLLRSTVFIKGVSPDAYIGIIGNHTDFELVDTTNIFIKEVFGLDPICFITGDPAISQHQYVSLSTGGQYPLLHIDHSQHLVNLIENHFSY